MLRTAALNVILHEVDLNLQCNYNLIMDDYDFQWDPRKADANAEKHGISFNEAKSVFSDILARLIPDPDSSYGEERFVILGQSNANRLLLVCHCYRDKGNVIRIISARKADKRERKIYEGFRDA